MGTSFWRRTTIDPPATEFPEGEHVDLVIAGAGFTGLITALMAAARGKSVVVLEAHTVGAGASGATTAKVSVLQGTRLSTLRSRHGLETARHYAEAHQYGLDWWAEFCETHGVSAQRRPALSYSRGALGTASLRKEKQTMDDLGLPARWHDRLDVPLPARSAVELPDQLQIDPVQALAALVEAVDALGVRIVEQSRVTKVTPRGDGADAHAEVRSDRGILTARDVLLATSGPSLDRGPTVATMEAERSYLCAFEYDGGLPEGMYGSVETPVRSLRTVPTENGEVLFVGGNGHRTGTVAPTGCKIESLREYAEKYFPGARMTHGWSAQDFHPVEMVPRSGPLPWGRGRVHYAGGYSKWGVSGSAAAAGIMVDRLEGLDPRVSFGKPTLTGVTKTAPSMYADLPVHMAAAAAKSVVRRPRPSVRPRGEATSDDGERCTVGLLCPHMGAVLSWNDVERSWDCPWHGSRFSACGELIEGPATSDLKRHDST